MLPLIHQLNETVMTANIIDLGYAVVDFDNESIAWNFQGFTAKRDKAIRKAFKTFAIDSDYLKTV